MKRMLVIFLALATCISCHKKTVTECKTDYANDLKQCDVNQDNCERAAKKKIDQCKSIKDSASRDKCMKDARAGLKACDADKDKCVDQAKKDKAKCKKGAK